MAQVRAKVRSKSDPSRSKSDPSGSNPTQSSPIRSKSGSGSVHGHSRSDPDRSMAAPGRIRIATPCGESSEFIGSQREPSERKPIGVSIVRAKCVVWLYIYIWLMKGYMYGENAIFPLIFPKKRRKSDFSRLFFHKRRRKSDFSVYFPQKASRMRFFVYFLTNMKYLGNDL